MRENQLRLLANRYGYKLMKSLGAAAMPNPVIADRWVCSWSLDEVESRLKN